MDNDNEKIKTNATIMQLYANWICNSIVYTMIELESDQQYPCNLSIIDISRDKGLLSMKEWKFIDYSSYSSYPPISYNDLYERTMTWQFQ